MVIIFQMVAKVYLHLWNGRSQLLTRQQADVYCGGSGALMTIRKKSYLANLLQTGRFSFQKMMTWSKWNIWNKPWSKALPCTERLTFLTAETLNQALKDKGPENAWCEFSLINLYIVRTCTAYLHGSSTGFLQDQLESKLNLTPYYQPRSGWV